MAYNPVPTRQKICVHCNTVYYAKDQRRMYCSSSCNTKAWMARRGLSGSDRPQTKPKQESGTLEPSLQNVGIIAAGNLAADATKAVLNAFFDEEPTNREVMDKLEEIKQMLLATNPKQATTPLKVNPMKPLVAKVIHGVPATEIEAQKAIQPPQSRRALKGPAPKPTGKTIKINPDTAGR